MEWFNFPYPFFSLQADPLFNVFAALIGLLICIATSSLLFLIGFIDTDNSSRGIVIFLGFIGLGFGAGVIRLTAPTAITALLGIL